MGGGCFASKMLGFHRGAWENDGYLHKEHDDTRNLWRSLYEIARTLKKYSYS